MELTFEDFDAIGVRPFTRYSPSNGCWLIECYRKKTAYESKGSGDWEMIRIGSSQSYFTRQEANFAALELAKTICIENNFDLPKPQIKSQMFGSVVVFEGLELVDDDDPFNYGEVESREELIKLCEDAVVHHTKWQDRDTYSAQKGVQSIYKGLTAGLDYLIVTKEDDNDYHSDEDTLIIEFIQPIDFDKLEKGLELKISSREDYFRDCDPNYDSEMFDSDGINFYLDWCSTYMPTRKRINEVGIGNDWY